LYQQQKRPSVPQIVNEPINDYDKFSERLNAMLLTDIIPGTIPANQNINNKPNFMINKQTNNKVDRPSSSLSRRSDVDNLNTINIGSNYYDFDSFLSSQQNNGQPVNSSFLQTNSRPSSAQQMSQTQQLNNYNSNTNSLVAINKQTINEFNSQIQDLSAKNFETQQKLKNLQNKQEMTGKIDNEFAVLKNILISLIRVLI
jgi:hypothetical protein